jgi:hypothetical protein
MIIIMVFVRVTSIRIIPFFEQVLTAKITKIAASASRREFHLLSLLTYRNRNSSRKLPFSPFACHIFPIPTVLLRLVVVQNIARRTCLSGCFNH